MLLRIIYQLQIRIFLFIFNTFSLSILFLLNIINNTCYEILTHILFQK